MTILTNLISVSEGPSIITAILEISIVCAVAGIIGQFFKLPFVPVLLVAGVLVGPETLGLVTNNQSFGDISLVAIIILLFGVGLEIDLKSNIFLFLKDCLIGLVACVLCTVTIYGALYAVGYNWQESLTIGMALSLSSTAVVLRILATSRQLKTQFGRLSLSILVTQDILVLGMLAMLPIMASTMVTNPYISEMTLPENNSGIFSIIFNLILVTFIIWGLKRVLPSLMNLALKERTPDVVLFVGIALSLIIANIISWLGFSIEIGAFVAGLVLAGTQFRYQLGSQLAPFREFFLGIFFLTVGMQLGLGVVWDEFLSIFGILILLLLCKIIGITTACILFKVHYSVAILTGFSLAQAGEFGLILLQQADSLALLSEKTNQIVLGSVIISLILTPFLLKLGQAFSHLSVFSKNPQFIDTIGDLKTDNEIIVVGYGPAGRRVAHYLSDVNINYHVIDLNINAIKQLEQNNISASLGDATQSEVLIHAGLLEAKYLIIAVPDENITLRVSAIAKSLNFKIQIIARLVHESQLDAAHNLQIDIPVVEETLVGNTLVEAIQAMLTSDKESYSL